MVRALPLFSLLVWGSSGAAPDPASLPTVAHGVVELAAAEGHGSGLCLSAKGGDVSNHVVIENFLQLDPCSKAMRWRYKQYPNSSKQHNYGGMGALMTAGFRVPECMCSTDQCYDGCEHRLVDYNFTKATMHSPWQVSIYQGHIADGQSMYIWDYHLNDDSLHEWCLVAAGPQAADTPVKAHHCGEPSSDFLHKQWIWKTVEGPSPTPTPPREVISGVVELVNYDGTGTGLCMSARDGDHATHYFKNALELEDCATAIPFRYEEKRQYYGGRGNFMSGMRHEFTDNGGDGFFNGCHQYLSPDYASTDRGDWSVSIFEDGSIAPDTLMQVWTDAFPDLSRWCLSVVNDTVARARVSSWNCTGQTERDSQGRLVSGVHRHWMWRTHAQIAAIV